MPAPTIDQITLADEPETWASLGFDVDGEHCQIGAVRLRLAGSRGDGDEGSRARAQSAASSRSAGAARTPSPQGRSGILAWSLRDALSAELDGLPTTVSDRSAPEPAPVHPNGVAAIDHVVAISPAFERSVAALRAAGLDLRRIREEPTPAGAPRQAFFRLGGEILELIEEPADVVARSGGPHRSVRFWGLALLADDLDRTAARFGEHVSEIRAAVQAGRRIATVRRSAGLCVPLALMSRAAGDRLASP